MRRALLVLLLILAFPAPARAAEDLAALLEKLAAREAKLKPIYTDGHYTITILSDDLDSKGASTSHEEIFLKHYHVPGEDDPGDDDHLIRFVKNGKDLTAEENAKDAKTKEARDAKKKNGSAPAKRDDGGPDFKSPFESAEQPEYDFTLLGPDPADATQTRIHFQPKVPVKERMIGDAILDPATAVVSKFVMHPSKMPMLVSRADVVMVIDTPAPGGPLLTTVTIDGEGGIFFVRKRVHMVTTFGGYVPPVTK